MLPGITRLVLRFTSRT
uniref:Uncharacterized protein n=1 Tax=Arundo donax TaxID=35708 RepID=A0A0A9AEM7_ARUDO